jgi:hypothetical protein
VEEDCCFLIVEGKEEAEEFLTADCTDFTDEED